MVELRHVSSSLRLLGQGRGHVRTYSGVRPDPSGANVADFMAGVSRLMAEPAAVAYLTARAELAEVQP